MYVYKWKYEDVSCIQSVKKKKLFCFHTARGTHRRLYTTALILYNFT
jgi:hypothetical protein